MANFKGTVFESTRMFVEKTFGAEGAERVLRELSHEDQEMLRGITAVGWYPIEPILHYHHAMDRLFGTGDFALCEQAGRFSAGWAMNSVLKMFLRFRTPTWLVERATSVWSRYHDSGRWRVSTNIPQRIQGDLFDFEVRDRAFCARLRGWLAGAIELTGGEGVNVIEKQCVMRGAECCSFVTTWRK
jgi:hypothetical protein